MHTNIRLARTLRDLYDPQREGTAFAIDGLVEPDVLTYWLQKGAMGQTSNQTLFLQQVEAGHRDADIQALNQQGRSPFEIYNILYNREAEESARAIQEWAGGADSLAFSRETDATRAADGEAIASEAQEIQAISPMVMVKLANVGVSPEAVRWMLREAVVRGAQRGVIVNPNITLVFGAQHYVNTVAGFIEGLEELVRLGYDVSGVRSVNSLFVSRVDTAVDGRIDQQLAATDNAADATCLESLKGKTAVAHAKKVYGMFRAIFLGEEFADMCEFFPPEIHATIKDLRTRFAKLKEQCPGVRPQRLLIASSGNKKPGVYSDLLYVLPFFGPYLGNTLPVKSLEVLEKRLNDIGIPVRDTVFDPLPWMPQNGDTIAAWEEAVMWGSAEVEPPEQILHLVAERVLAPQGVSLFALCDDLRDKGAQAFAQDQMKAYEVFKKKVEALTGS